MFFGQDFKAEILNVKFCQDFEAEFWSSFQGWLRLRGFWAFGLKFGQHYEMLNFDETGDITKNQLLLEHLTLVTVVPSGMF